MNLRIQRALSQRETGGATFTNHLRAYKETEAETINKPAQTEEYISLQVSHLQDKSFPKSTMLECIKRELFP